MNEPLTTWVVLVKVDDASKHTVAVSQFVTPIFCEAASITDDMRREIRLIAEEANAKLLRVVTKAEGSQKPRIYA